MNKENHIISTTEEKLGIEHIIYRFRNQYVMIDSDLAILYGVETKRINEQVKRNPGRFPKDFMFQLTSEEVLELHSMQGCSDLKSQIATSSWGGRRKSPYAFTENGIAMLSSVLKSETAISVNIKIMREFTSMRHSLSRNNNLLGRIESIEYHQLKIEQHLNENDNKFDEIFNRMDSHYNGHKQGIFYDGQIYDAYSFVADLVRQASERIILIDNYIDDSVLTLLDKRGKGVYASIYTKSISKQLRLDIDRHNQQYENIDVKVFNKAHDRFMIVDDKVYLIGASIKDLGKKWFGFTLMENTDADELVNRI